MNNRMSRPLYEVDPDVATAIDNEERRQHEGLELIASRELRQRGRAGSHGLGVHQQVRRGLSRQALLRRLRVHRRGREPRPRARQAALRRRACQRAAALRLVGQHGGLRRSRPAGRRRLRPEPGARRPPDPRASPEFFRQDLQDRPLRRDPGNGDDRLRRPGEDGGARAAEADHRRRLGLSAHHRFRAHAPDRRQGRSALPGGHGALRRTGGRRACIPRRCRTRRSSPPPPTRRCAGRARA